MLLLRLLQLLKQMGLLPHGMAILMHFDPRLTTAPKTKPKMSTGAPTAASPQIKPPTREEMLAAAEARTCSAAAARPAPAPAAPRLPAPLQKSVDEGKRAFHTGG